MEQRKEPRNKLMHTWSVYSKETKKTEWERNSLFNKWCLENWTATCQRLKLDHCLKTIPKKINSKWIKELNLRLEIIKLPRENIDSKLFDNQAW